MRRLIFGVLLLAACKSNSRNGTYVNHTEGQYAIMDDTLIVSDDAVINRSGFYKMRNGRCLPKEYSLKQWPLNSPDLPALQIAGGKLILSNSVYTKIQ